MGQVVFTLVSGLEQGSNRGDPAGSVRWVVVRIALMLILIGGVEGAPKLVHWRFTSLQDDPSLTCEPPSEFARLVRSNRTVPERNHPRQPEKDSP